jgi:transcription elongation factor GreA
MNKVAFYSQEGLDKLREELTHLTSVERKKISEQIAEARDKGDLSENAEYDAAKDAQGLLELKISKLQTLIANARILDESKIDVSKVLLFTKVTILNLNTNSSMSYTLVPETEADLKSGKLSVTSPIAKSLLGKKIGEVVQVQAPAGTIDFKITEVTRD